MIGAGPIVRADAPAKVNLYLHVVGRRSDGYHLLDSLVVFPAVGDTIEVEPSGGLSLEVTGRYASEVPADGDNLVLRAAYRLAEAAGCAPAARIRLVKRLPVASGIGGGSADAAAALRALAQMWRLDPATVDLGGIALSLGADVPMCLESRSLFMSGIGEALVPAPPLPPFALVLANPGIAVATPSVFSGRSGAFSTPAPFSSAPVDARALAGLLATRTNDLANSAEAQAPEIASVRAALAATPGALLARMSGSGATCFAMFEEQRTAEEASDALARAHPDWWLAAAPVAGSPPSG